MALCGQSLSLDSQGEAVGEVEGGGSNGPNEKKEKGKEKNEDKIWKTKEKMLTI